MRAVSGALWDIVLDLRSDSPTVGRHFATELTAKYRRMMYVPRGLAHRFLTLQPDSESLYLLSAFYEPELERGIRSNGPRFEIEWPSELEVISDKDANHPDRAPELHSA